MRVLLAGQRWFGVEVFTALSAIAQISHVSAPVDDRLYSMAGGAGATLIEAGKLNATTMPDGIDLIVAAHSHDFIGEKTRMRARWGGIGYHPSLLPVHRGRDAIEWAVRMRDRVTGGTVYRLSNKMDGGAILAQRHTFIAPDDDARTLWRRDLGPLGVQLLTEAVAMFARDGYVAGTEQNETFATWEPSIGRPPAFRPDLIMLGHDSPV